MTGLNHGLTGAVIALKVKSPAYAIPLAFLSHFATDLIPHFGIDDSWLFTLRFNGLLIADFLLSIASMIILALLFPHHIWQIWACMIAAASPDLTSAYYRLYLEHIKKRQPHYDRLTAVHYKMQWFQRPIGAVVEVSWFVAAWTLILVIHR